jgi:hypothetical protein
MVEAADPRGGSRANLAEVRAPALFVGAAKSGEYRGMRTFVVEPVTKYSTTLTGFSLEWKARPVMVLGGAVMCDMFVTEP